MFVRYGTAYLLRSNEAVGKVPRENFRFRNPLNIQHAFFRESLEKGFFYSFNARVHRRTKRAARARPSEVRCWVAARLHAFHWFTYRREYFVDVPMPSLVVAVGLGCGFHPRRVLLERNHNNDTFFRQPRCAERHLRVAFSLWVDQERSELPTCCRIRV